MLRTFAAVKIEPNKELNELLHTCKTLFSPTGVKWVEPYNLHITLRFLGNTSSEIIPSIISELKQVAQDQPAFDLELIGLDVFGTTCSPKIIYVGVLPCSPFQQLSRAIEQRACNVGFEPQTTAFTPHLTLGRPKGMGNELLISKLIAEFRTKSFGVFPVHAIYYYQTVSTGHGPIYQAIEVIPLR